MKNLLPHLVIALTISLSVLAGCRSGSEPLQTFPVLDLSGRYHSSEDYGELGRLTLQIELLEDSQQFKAWLAGANESTGLSEGVGTYGDGHVILDFDWGFDSNFFFEGLVEVVDGEIQAIDGNFVFADRDTPAPIRFNFVELVQ